MNYEELLKKAMQSLPKKEEEKKRFVVPAIEFEFVGKKTLFKNFGQIATVLRRDQNHLSKYLLKELAVPGSVEGGTLILQRKLPISLLQEKLNSYIKKFVYCKVCGQPDTNLVKEDRLFFMVCEACGAKYPAEKIG
ncbi:MAG: translation initiation factor IF-2 subunit beta [Candidatus Aenigmatarchaeota archaeon]